VALLVGASERKYKFWEAFFAIYSWFNATLNYICTFIIKSILILFEMKISGRHIGEMLKEAREQRQLTQEQLAKKWVRKGVTFLRSKLIMAIISNFKPLKR
jgi:hypothetical protein